VKNFEGLQKSIETARSSPKKEWYETPQSVQFTGPYRHHIKKRRIYVDTAIKAFIKGRGKPIIGLDPGCGDGSNIPWMSTYVTDLYACDYNLLRLMRAQNQPGGKQVFLADALNLPVANDTFDLIYFNHVLEHIPDDEKALQEICRVLKPGGLMVLGVPNEGVAFWHLAYRLQPRIKAITDHVHFYTADSIGHKCKRAGFSIKEIHHIGWGVPHWTLDAVLRNFKIIDDMFEIIGRKLCPEQATSLYLLLSK